MKIFQSATRIALLVLVFTVCYLAIRGIPVSEQFQSVAIMVVSFFFGTKVNTTEPSKG
jgi:hypothetical protein